MRLTVLVVALLVSACGTQESPSVRDSVPQRTRDSVIGASKLPGAAGVRGAMRLSDSADARNTRAAEIAPEP